MVGPRRTGLERKPVLDTTSASTSSTWRRPVPRADPTRPAPPLGAHLPDRFEIGAVTTRLQTDEGRKLWKSLAADLAPHLADTGLLEPGAIPVHQLMKMSPLHRALVVEASQFFEPAANLPRALPSVIGETLATIAGEDGLVDRATVLEKLGTEGLEFLDAVWNAKGAMPALADRLTFDRLTPEAASAILKSNRFEEPKMPALDWAESLARPGELEGMSFYGLQHLFQSSATLFGALERTGINPEDMTLQGKIYSTNHATAAFMESKGARISETSKFIAPATSYEDAMKASILHDLTQMVGRLPAKPEKNPKPEVLLIDDGGKAIELLHEHFPEHAPYFVAVEQTRRGARAVREIENLRCPVVNVAESWAKLEWESPMIGHSVVLEVGKKLSELELAGVDTGESALVIGYGSVGSAVAEALRERGKTVHIYDADPEKSTRARLDAGDPPLVVHDSLDAALPNAQTLISCVGQRTLEAADHRKLPDGAVLVNAASSDDELGPEDLLPFRSRGGAHDEEGRIWTHFQGKPICLGHGEARAHSSSVARLPNGHELLVVGNGYVVNMTGERDPIPPRYIQLTRSLLYLGALAAVRADGPGLHDVPEDWQRELVDRVRTELAETGESLGQPNWDQFEAHTLAPPAVAPQSVRDAMGLGKPMAHPEGTTYGYTLGPPKIGSFEEALVRNYGGEELTPLGAALHKIKGDLGAFLPFVFFDITLPDAALREPPEIAPGADPEVELKTQFEGHYANLLIHVLANWGEGHGHDLTSPELTKQVHRCLLDSGVEPTRVIGQMQRHPEAAFRKLGQQVYRLHRRG